MNPPRDNYSGMNGFLTKTKSKIDTSTP